MLATLTSRQVADWLAYATMEVVGQPVPPDKQAQAQAEQKAKADNLRGWFHSRANK